MVNRDTSDVNARDQRQWGNPENTFGRTRFVYKEPQCGGTRANLYQFLPMQPAVVCAVDRLSSDRMFRLGIAHDVIMVEPNSAYYFDILSKPSDSVLE
jgi:hypothetical protein